MKKEVTSGKHYEEEFKFEFWHMIKDYAEKNDISYQDASRTLLPEWQKKIRYRDKDFEDQLISERRKQMLDISEHERHLEEMIHGGKNVENE